MRALLMMAVSFVASVLYGAVALEDKFNRDREDYHTRQLIREEIDADWRQGEWDRELEKSRREQREKYLDQMNWMPDNDTTKEENKGREWDSSQGEFKYREESK